MIVFLRVILTLALLAVAGYGIWEYRRWGTPEAAETISPRQRRLRVSGLIFLLLDLGLWLRGTFLPTPHTRLALAHDMAYWMLTVLICVPLIPIALLDARENVHRALAERRRLRQDVFSTLRHPDSKETK